jgi:DNA-binding transcriptional ArsR family regulator
MPDVVFTCTDLARTRIAGRPSCHAELVFSLRMLGEAPHRCFSPWRLRVTRRLDPRVALLVHALGPDRRAAPVGARLGGHLTEVLNGYERLAIAPYWNRIRTLVDADRVRRGRALLDGGVDQLLATLHPQVRWDPPVLTVGSAESRADRIRLDGLGLVLQPSVFVWRSPVLFRPGSGPPTLLYPVGCELTEAAGSDPLDLAALLGRTRAAMLHMLTGTGATTTELANGTGLSLAAASQHTGVLREAGLITTQRVGRGRLHALTPLGSALLSGDLVGQLAT